MDFKPILSKTKKRIAKIGLSLLRRSFVDNIPDELTRASIQELAVEPLGASLDALADKDPNDKEQIRQIWKGVATRNVPDLLDDAVTTKLGKLQNANLRIWMLHHFPYFVQTVRVLTDEIKPNDKQLEQIWEQFTTNPQSLSVNIQNALIPIAKKRIDPERLELLEEILAEIFAEDLDAV